MSKLHWCLAGGLVLATGAMAMRHLQPARPGVAGAVPPLLMVRDRAPAPATGVESLSRAISAPVPVLVELAYEPIVTRLQLLEMPRATDTPVTIHGGDTESAVDAPQAPRPDLEMRRMPYADER